MHLDARYLKRVAMPVTGAPEEVALNGEEARGGPAIGIDDIDGTYLSVVYRDGYDEDARYDFIQGTEKRTTFVVPRRGQDAVGNVGYRFPGLIHLEDLRTWYRANFEVIEIPPPPSPLPWNVEAEAPIEEPRT